MADWRQIQARIRKAKASADPIPALTRIYDRTRDAMAAFELATVHEGAGRGEEAVHWFTKAWQRFRRQDWKQRAAEGITRLGGTMPEDSAPSEAELPEQVAATGLAEEPTSREEAEEEAAAPEGVGDLMAAAAEPQPEGSGEPAAAPGKKRSRRGRRGGRRHRRKKEREPGAKAAEPARPSEEGEAAKPARRHAPAPAPAASAEAEIPRVGSEWAARGRAGDPGLASRVARLESKLRRLMASPLFGMNEIEQAPAGPGVFVLSDSDHTTYYYVEACRTLRIALGNIARGRAGEGSIKRTFAQHLGISESQVGKYIKEHCVVRWLQLDEEASLLAHFAIAVLGPVLNE